MFSLANSNFFSVFCLLVIFSLCPLLSQGFPTENETAHDGRVGQEIGDNLEGDIILPPSILSSGDTSLVESQNEEIVPEIFGTGEDKDALKLQKEIAELQKEISALKQQLETPIQRMKNYAANVNRKNWPAPRVSYKFFYDNEWDPLDGRISYKKDVHNRWTNYESPNEKDWYEIDFGPGRSKVINQTKLYVYSDVVTGDGGVDCPKSMTVELFDGANWIAAPNQTATPSVCSPNDVNTIEFTPVKTQRVRVVFERDSDNNHFVGITELEIWAPWPQAPENTYEAEDAFITNADMRASASASGGSFVGGINHDDSSVEFTDVWVDRPGMYSIKVFYANALDDEATHRLLVNKRDRVVVTYLPTHRGWGNFDHFVTIEAPLQRGNNVLNFRKGHGYAELDRIQVLV